MDKCTQIFFLAFLYRAMFTNGLRERSESRISLNGLTATSTAHLIDFAYNSSINIDSGKCYVVFVILK